MAIRNLSGSSLGLGRLLQFLLLDLFDLINQGVGVGQVFGAVVGVVHSIGLLAVQQVEISHGVIVIRAHFNGLFQAGDALVDRGAILGGKFVAQLGGKRVGVLDGLADVGLVVFGAYIGVAAEGQRPINDPDAVVGFRVIAFDLGVLHVVRAGLLQLLGFVGLAAHLENHGTDAVNCREVFRVGAQHILEFSDGLVAAVDVVLGGHSGHVQVGVGGGQVEARIQQCGVEFLRRFEHLDGRVELLGFVGLHALVELVAGLQLAAPDDPHGRQGQQSDGKRNAARTSRGD